MLPILMHCKLIYWKREETALAPQVMNRFNASSGQ